ncbi:MAG TPA: MCP four helix bundle domain-containing protein, partial [Sulfuricurvum sp.]|nr:MCP four helix bundle domain-containing protein [Sulfuricurvum sp.]
MAFEQTLNKMSIKQRMNYLVSAATVAVIGASIFVFFAMRSLENQYDELQNKTIEGALISVEIEKNLNYISRTSRDIMLGGNYTKNIAKLEEHSATINNAFVELEKTVLHPNEKETIKQAKDSTTLFLTNTLKMMKSLDPTYIAANTSSIYALYKKEMTPYADASRDSFEKVVKDKREDLANASKSMHSEIEFYKFFVLITGVAVAVIIFLFASMIRSSITIALGKFTCLITNIAEGDFTQTSVNAEPGTEMGIMGSALEQLIKQIQSLIHQINASISGATKGDFSHTLSSAGMHGEFIDAIENVSTSIAVMK